MPEAQETDLTPLTKGLDRVIDDAKNNADPTQRLNNALGDIQSQVSPMMDQMAEKRDIKNSSLGMLPQQQAISSALSQKTKASYENALSRFKRGAMAEGYGVHSMDQLHQSLQATNQIMQMRRHQLELKSEYQYEKAKAKGALTGIIGGFFGTYLGNKLGGSGPKKQGDGGGAGGNSDNYYSSRSADENGAGTGDSPQSYNSDSGTAYS